MISQVGPGAQGSARKAGPKSHSEVEVVAEDMASFLARQQAYLQGSGGGVGAPGVVPGGVPPGAVNPGGSPVNQATKGGEGQRKSIGSVSPGGQNSPKKVILIILCRIYLSKNSVKYFIMSNHNTIQTCRPPQNNRYIFTLLSLPMFHTKFIENQP